MGFQLREKSELVQASQSDKHLQNKIEELSEMLELKQQEIDNFRAIMRQAEAEKIKMESRMAEIEQFRHELAKESNQHMEEAGEKMKELRNQADDKQEEVNGLLLAKEVAEKEIQKLRFDLDQSKKQYESLLETQDSGTDKIVKERDALKEKNDKLTNMCKKYIAKIKKQDVQIKEMEEKEQLGQAGNDQIEALNSRILEMEAQLQECNSSNGILMEEMTSKYLIIEELQNQVVEKEQEYTQLSSELAERESVIKEKEEVINSKDDSIREMKQRLEEAPEDVSVQIDVTQNVLALEKTKSELAALKEKKKKKK